MLNPINVHFWEKIHPSEARGTNSGMSYPVRCDICGDSQKSSKKKRLNLYTKQGYDGDVVACFNCGYSSSMFNYIKHYHPSYLNEYINATRETYIEALFPKMEEKEIVKEYKKHEGLVTFNVELPPETEYPKKRGVSSDGFYYSKVGLETPDGFLNLYNFVVYPFLTENNEWYGFYSRNKDNKIFRVYLPKENAGYKIANWFKVDKSKPVYIFEGLFDALSSGKENWVALCGATMNDKLLKELSEPIFCLDNDSRGITEMKKYAELGYKVCVWGDVYKGFKDFNDLHLGGYNVSEIIDSCVDDGITAVVRMAML